MIESTQLMALYYKHKHIRYTIFILNSGKVLSKSLQLLWNRAAGVLSASHPQFMKPSPSGDHNTRNNQQQHKCTKYNYHNNANFRCTKRLRLPSGNLMKRWA